jgi:hypothetical protein
MLISQNDYCSFTNINNGIGNDSSILCDLATYDEWDRIALSPTFYAGKLLLLLLFISSSSSSSITHPNLLSL